MYLIWQRIISNQFIRFIFYLLWISLAVGIVLASRLGKTEQLSKNININGTMPQNSKVVTSHSNSDAQLTTVGTKNGFIQSHAELCPELGLKKKLAVIVFTKPIAKAARMTARLTWGHFGLRRDVMTVFVTSLSFDAKTNNELKEEDLLYGDLLIESRASNEFDTILDWINKHCPNIKFVLKTSDNTFVNIPKILNFTATQIPNKNNIFCNIAKSFPRSVKRCSSGTYLMTMDAMKNVLKNIKIDEKLIEFDDKILETVDSLNVSKVHVDGFYDNILLFDACRIQNVFAIKRLDFKRQFEYWVKSVNTSLDCDKQKKQMDNMRKSNRLRIRHV